MGSELVGWQQKLAAAKTHGTDFWRFDVLGARAVVSGMLSEVAERLGGGTVVEIADVENLELHAKLGAAQFRVDVWMRFGSFRTISVLGADALADLWLERGRGDDGLVSLAEGVWLNPHEDADRELATWRGIPEGTRGTVLREMARLDVNSLNTDRRWVSLQVRPGLEDLEDPVGYVLSAAKLLELFGGAVPREGG